MPHFNKRGRIYIPELFEMIGKVRSRKDRKEVLLEYARRDESHFRTLRGVIECCLHPGVVFDLPEGDPPYKKGDYPDYNFADTNLFNVVRKVGYFCECPKKIANPIRRESVFIQMLESLHPKEAKVLLAMKDKQLPDYRGLSESLIRDAFPNWLPEETKEAKKSEKGETKDSS